MLSGWSGDGLYGCFCESSSIITDSLFLDLTNYNSFFNDKFWWKSLKISKKEMISKISKDSQIKSEHYNSFVINFLKNHSTIITVFHWKSQRFPRLENDFRDCQYSHYFLWIPKDSHKKSDNIITVSWFSLKNHPSIITVFHSKIPKIPAKIPPRNSSTASQPNPWN